MALTVALKVEAVPSPTCLVLIKKGNLILSIMPMANALAGATLFRIDETQPRLPVLGEEQAESRSRCDLTLPTFLGEKRQKVKDNKPLSQTLRVNSAGAAAIANHH